MKKNLNQIVKGYFKLYPKAKVLYATDDGNVFLEKSPAVDHATKTKQKWHEFTPGLNEPAGDNDPEKAAKELAANREKLQNADLTQMDYHNALDLAKALKLSLADNKKETVITALEEAKNELETANHK